MFERFSQSARTAVEDARYEAELRGDRRIGTEHLLVALLEDDALAQIVGADAHEARAAAERLDRAALEAIGIELGEFQPTGRPALGRHARVTAGVKAVLQQTLATAAAEKARAITARHILLALVDRPHPDPAAALLATLAVDRAAVRERLRPAD
jgi:ATP-dependent Clp protease ATP-binding subunit ClpA